LVSLSKNIIQTRRSAEYGITVRNETPDYEKLIQRKNYVVSLFREGLENSLLHDPNITIFHGKGSFTGYKEIAVQLEDSTYKSIAAPQIFINTGTLDRIPDIVGL